MTNYDSAIDRSERLKTTLATPGWQDIRQFMSDKKAHYTQIALTEKDINKIYYAQAFVEAIDTIQSEIEGLIREGEGAEKRSKKKK